MEYLTFRKASINDLESIMLIIKKTIIIMKSENNPQWDENYPTAEKFLHDIESGSLFVKTNENDIPIACICINMDSDPAYSAVKWSLDKPFYVLHRIAVDPLYRRKGIASSLLSFAEEYVKSNSVNYIRTDTYSQNTGMNKLFRNSGYIFRGEVHFRNLPDPFNCYDRVF